MTKIILMEENPKKGQTPTFMLLENYGFGYVLADKDTHVMYWMSGGYYNNGNLTLLVNDDGSPKIWNEN